MAAGGREGGLHLFAAAVSVVLSDGGGCLSLSLRRKLLFSFLSSFLDRNLIPNHKHNPVS